MNQLDKPTIVITSGGTFEKWDMVRGHTNLSKGTVGMYLAKEALRAGYRVRLLHGMFAELPAANPNLQLETFEGVEDLRERLQRIVTTEPVSCVIMSAAVSDWVVEKFTDREGNDLPQDGKTSSTIEPVLYLKRAPKIIPEIKTWNPDMLLVGFKLIASDRREDMIAEAQRRLQQWRADIVIANAIPSLYTTEAMHYYTAPDEEAVPLTNKRHVAQEVVSRIHNKLQR